MGEKKKNGENIDINSFKDDFLKGNNLFQMSYKKYKKLLKSVGKDDFSLSKTMDVISSKISTNFESNSLKQDIGNYEEFDEKIKKEEILRLTNLNKHWWNKRSSEPRKGILTDDEILKYTGDSMAASEIRLKKGIGSFSDKTVVNNFNILLVGGWVAVLYLGLFLLPVTREGISLVSIIFLIFFFILLLCMVYYTVYLFHLKDYTSFEYKEQLNEKEGYNRYNEGYEYNSYKETVVDLEKLYKVKEKLAIDLIEKRFSSESMTYDRFISTIHGSRDAFYNTLNSIFSIIEINPNDNLTVRKELETKISILKAIIGKVDELTNELVINLSKSEVDNDVKELLDDMELLIDSVKDYK